MQEQTPLTLDDVVRFPLPGMNIPGAVRFAPDGRALTYLRSSTESLVRELYWHDLEEVQPQTLVHPPDEGITEENISLPEILRRERLRQRELGITQYSWSPISDRLLIPLQDTLYVQQGVHGRLVPLLSGGEQPLLDPQFSPDGEWVAYVQDAELHVVSAAGGQPHQITRGARGTGKTHGLAEYIAQEELDRRHGYWWSPDSRYLAFTLVDETHIPVYRIMHQGKESPGDGAQEDHHYPFAGAANARVKLGVVSRTGGERVWMDLDEYEEFYLARVKWLPDGRLAAQLLNRAQNQLDLLIFDPQTGRGQRLLLEHSDVWINLHHLYRPLRDGRFVWGSEKSGYRHLYLHAADGAEMHPLTTGDWMVDELVGVDQAAELLYFTAAYPLPTERHLFVVPLAGGEPRRLTHEPGLHNVVVDRQFTHFVDTLHGLEKPPEVRVCTLENGEVERMIATGADGRVDTLDLPLPQLITLDNRQGDRLYGAIYRPPTSFGAGPFPTIVSVYGGPHAQRVTNSWGLRVDMRAQYLAQQGFLVFKLDNRGSARRGLAFEAGIWHNMGEIEVQDQVDGVHWLVGRGLADPERVGIYGWSYGGYMALMCLCRGGETFKTAVAGAPVTHWDGYDTGYTERYMGRPQENTAGYERSSVMTHVQQITGQLLLVHGLIDENVHFRHTARLINALIAAGKRYELLLFPDERHTPRRAADRRYMEARIRDFFRENL